MKIKRFEDIIAWQKARELTLEVYRTFSKNKDFGSRDQILRSMISVSNNIAAGFERMGTKEFKKFLFISKGSCAELRSMLDIALDLKYISRERHRGLYSNALEISKILSGLIKKM